MKTKQDGIQNQAKGPSYAKTIRSKQYTLVKACILFAESTINYHQNSEMFKCSYWVIKKQGIYNIHKKLQFIKSGEEFFNPIDYLETYTLLTVALVLNFEIKLKIEALFPLPIALEIVVE